ncbi:hypothetical protein [Cohaesibacter gelatinilyticus]|uniref:Uncharacterized protein n=1 Tax=Cohaesibacter gelatinilyticus TaxID=372072 RepID=A0A285PEG8_9HYPH|nr:hypothetical protein [Cohaesibacter gelatinilyticus]SNZ20150.1 hypothetical protein SAMN06265368_3253 [Cohaesibacter gelatinilyticus]
MNYKSDIDGLCAVAVMSAVLLGHWVKHKRDNNVSVSIDILKNVAFWEAASVKGVVALGPLPLCVRTYREPFVCVIYREA